MNQPGEMRENLRQMIAVLQAERQALAGLDLDAIIGARRTRLRCAARWMPAGRSPRASPSTRNAAACSTLPSG